MFKLKFQKSSSEKKFKTLKLYKILLAVSSIIGTMFIGYLIVWAGTLNPPTGPSVGLETEWPHYPNLEDIYCKLGGSGCAPVNYTIDSPHDPEPSGETMHTVQDIYDLVPDLKTHSTDPNMAVEADVLSTKKFYNDSGVEKSGTAACATNDPSAAIIAVGESVCGVAGTFTGYTQVKSCISWSCTGWCNIGTNCTQTSFAACPYLGNSNKYSEITTGTDGSVFCVAWKCAKAGGNCYNCASIGNSCTLSYQ